ncbi:MAG TPA: hypothetical protein V6C52_14500 [Coleofasciculaceae cyanobacterium]
MTRSQEIVSGVVRSREALESLIKELESRGYSKGDISLVMSEVTRNEHYVEDALTRGASAGMVAGGLLGLLIGALSVVPGGMVVAGPLLGLLAGGAIGALAGTMIQMMFHLGIPETEAQLYERTLLKEPGSVLVVVRIPPGGAISEIQDVMGQFGARHVTVTGSKSWAG